MKSTLLDRWLRALCYGAVLIAAIFVFAYVQSNYDTFGADNNTVALLLVLLVGDLVFGALLGAEHLLRQLRKKGRFTCNIPRLVVLCVPTLLFGVLNPNYLSIFISVAVPDNFPAFLTVPMFFMLNQIVFAYGLITSFSKVKSQAAPSPETDNLPSADVPVTDQSAASEPHPAVDGDLEYKSDADEEA